MDRKTPPKLVRNVKTSEVVRIEIVQVGSREVICLLDASTAQRILGVKADAFRNLVANGELAEIAFGSVRVVRFALEDLDAYIDSRRRRRTR